MIDSKTVDDPKPTPNFCMKSHSSAIRWTIFCTIYSHLLQADSVCAEELAGEKVVPITSVVVPVKDTDEQLNWEEVVQAYLTGNRLFDAKYRSPTGPTFGVAVDCSRSQKLGAIIEFKTKKRDVDDVLPLRFSWTHSDSSDDVRDQTNFRAAWFMPKIKGVLIYSDYLSLSDERRRNGTWVLRVYYLGDQVYREEFDLEFCERDYAPNWYRE